VREPYAIGLKTGETFCFADIWEEWVEPAASVRLRVQEAAIRRCRRQEWSQQRDTTMSTASENCAWSGCLDQGA
jgi:putative SOS response-associated peptidase YedK